MRNIFIPVIALISLCETASADADAERTLLSQLIHDIEAVQPLIEKAQSQANPDARIRFQYGWLSQDLDRIKLGIREHLNAPRAHPRRFPPLKGDYRR